MMKPLTDIVIIDSFIIQFHFISFTNYNDDDSSDDDDDYDDYDDDNDNDNDNDMIFVI